ncbi:KamA family radical SAM protein [Gammaproteobacteria bacterium]|nr:KamA family radical SAM protein [Gammaproteobacteria bacterium]
MSADNIPTWQMVMQQTITQIDDLFDYLHLDSTNRQAFSIKSHFPIKVTRPFASRMQKNNPNDPLLKQILTPAATNPASFSQDPLAEKTHQPLPSLIHKYHNRVLLTLTSVCASHCQYCFRQHFGYHNPTLSSAKQSLIPWLNERPHIHELILSGGDPLCLSDTKLKQWLDLFTQCSHLKRLRIHTRTPIFIPQRVTDQLCQTLKTFPLPVIIVIHTNHPNELDASTKKALHQLSQSCAQLLNQSVLLKGINDDPSVLLSLSEKLFSQHVLPYYLHQLDPVDGSQSYALSNQQAGQIVASLAKQCSGYLMPRWVQEQPHLKAKRPLGIDPSDLT